VFLNGRREFITLLGAAAAWPLAARARQNDRIKRIGVLVGAATEHDPESEARLAAFRTGLKELGWFEGRNVRIDYRFASGDADRIRTYVTELVKSAPDLIVANSSPVVAELKRATSTIPIVFAVVNDPVNQGLVTSLASGGQYHGLHTHRIRDHREMARATEGDGASNQPGEALVQSRDGTFLRELAARARGRVRGLNRIGAGACA
jgi:ABC-type uncharacterized transport system substrate-binding protein